jgi:hypothetical protein
MYFESEEWLVAAVILWRSAVIRPLQHLSMMFGVVIYKFTGDSVVTPREHGAVRRFFDIPFSVGFCCIEVVLCGLGVVNRCPLMIVNGFFVGHVCIGFMCLLVS